MNATAIPTVSSVSVVAPTEKQIERLARMGVTQMPATRSQASAMISKMIAARDTQPATQAQLGRAAALGGRDLPGAGVREKSTQIAILEAYMLWQQAETDEAHSAAIELLLDRVAERFVKAVAAAPAGESAPM